LNALYLNISLNINLIQIGEIYICISRHWIMFLFILICSIYFILLDELIMGSAQRRIGPFNLGGYGFFSIFGSNSCLSFGLSGLLSRPVKIWIDSRFSGYEFHQSLDYSIFITSNGDCLDRYPPRYNEMIESCRIIYAIPYLVLKIKVNAAEWSVESFDCSRTNLNNNRLCSSRLSITELLIAEFLIQVPFIPSSISELKFSIFLLILLCVNYSIFIRSTYCEIGCI